MKHAALDDSVCNFWEGQGLTEGENLDVFIARQPAVVMSEWRAFLTAERDEWRQVAMDALQCAKDAEAGPRGHEDDIGERHRTLHDEAMDCAAECQEMFDMAATERH